LLIHPEDTGVLAKRCRKIFYSSNKRAPLGADVKRFLLFTTLVFIAVGCAQIDKDALGESRTVAAANATTHAGILLATTVVSAPGHTGLGFYDRQKALNGVRGGGTGAQSTDVFSLDNPGFNNDSSTELVLSWGGKRILNGTGIDFIVFENAFYQSGDANARFMDLLIVEVSDDNINYCGFAPDYSAVTETNYSNNPAHWQNFAGVSPVLYNIENNNLTLQQLFEDINNDKVPDQGGGDGFDLALLSDSNTFATGCTMALRDSLRDNGFRYLRLVPASRRINPDTSAAFASDAASNGPDIDGVAARYSD